jgi:hypothetical protein
MPKKKTAKKPARKLAKSATRTLKPARKRTATLTAGRTRTKSTKKVSKKIARRTKEKERVVRTPSKPIAPSNQPLFPIAATAHGLDPKAERLHEHAKKMGGIESPRVEEHHQMTRHRKNQ